MARSDVLSPAGSAPSPRSEDRPALARWMHGAGPGHPLLDLVSSPPADAALDRVWTQALDAYEDLLSALETADAARWTAKRQTDFPALTRHGQLLEFRAELLVARALHDADVDYQLGNTKISNPDFILPGYDLGVEVTARAPLGISDLYERLEELLRAWPGIGVRLSFSLYPSRLYGEPVAELAEKVTIAAAQMQQSGSPVTVTQQVDDPKNVESITIEVVLTPREASGTEQISWEVRAGELSSPLSSAEYAVFEIGRSAAKADQARAVAGGVILAVDLSRYGAAWLRPAAVWPGLLARRFTPDFPFAAIAIFRQDLTCPHILDSAVAISGYASADARRRVEELCMKFAWPHAIGTAAAP